MLQSINDFSINAWFRLYSFSERSNPYNLIQSILFNLLLILLNHWYFGFILEVLSKMAERNDRKAPLSEHLSFVEVDIISGFKQQRTEMAISYGNKNREYNMKVQ